MPIQGTSTETIEAADRAASEQADAALEEIMGSDDEPQTTPDDYANVVIGEDADNNGRERDEKGRFKPKENQEAQDTKKDTDEPDTSDEKPVPAEEKSDKSDDVNPEAFRKSLSVLQRDNVPQDIIDKLDPSQVIEWANRREKVHADQDAIGNKVKELEKQLEQAQSESSKTDSETTEPEIDIDSAIDPVAKQFQEILGDDVDFAGAMKSLGNELAKSLSQQYQKQIESVSKENKTLRDTLDSLKSEWVETQRAEAREKLERKYNLSDDERWNRVVERRKQDKNEYPSEHEAIASAARLEFSDEIIADYEKKLKAEHKRQDNGQVTPESRRDRPTGSKSVSEQEDELLGMIIDDAPDHEIEKRATRYQVPSALDLASRSIGR